METSSSLEQCADEFLRNRDFLSAIDLLKSLVDSEEFPNADACVKLARAYKGAGNPEKALRWASQVAEQPGSFRNWAAAGRIVSTLSSSELEKPLRKMRVGIIATWTTAPFVPLLRLAALHRGILLDIYESAFDQYFQEALDPSSQLHQQQCDAILLCPDHRALGLPTYSPNFDGIVESSVERWTGIWGALKSHSPKAILIQHLFAEPFDATFGNYGAGLPASRAAMLWAINRSIATLALKNDVGIVDTEKLAQFIGKNRWFDDRNWHLAKLAASPPRITMACAAHCRDASRETRPFQKVHRT